MDPDAALLEVLDAVDAGEAEWAGEVAEGLAAWVRRGGFLPHWPEDQERADHRYQLEWQEAVDAGRISP